MKVFQHSAHIALWDWLSKNPLADKDDWIGWKRNGGMYPDDVACDCFACDYEEDYCCPLIWEDINGEPCKDCNSDEDGLFSAWQMDKDNLKQRVKFAEKIRDLKVNEDVKCV